MTYMDSKVARRASELRPRLEETINAVGGVLVSFPPPGVWRSTQAGTVPGDGMFDEQTGGTFGWSWAIPHDETPGYDMIVGFCPEIIAESSAMLDDEEFDDYVTAIEMLVLLDIGFLNEMPDWRERRRAVESHLAESFPATLESIATVELAVAFG